MSNRTLKGFFRIPILEDNRAYYTAKFGELSTEARTYSRDLRDYANNGTYSYPSIVCFSYKDEYGQQFASNPSTPWQDYVLSIGQWIVERYLAEQIPPNSERDKFWSQLTSEFTDPIWSGMGVISQMPNTAKFMPEWISFDLDDGGYPVTTKIWLSDPTFQNEYDEWETIVIPPADPIDLVQSDFNTVSAIVRQRNNIETINNLINEAKKNKVNNNLLDPETKTTTVALKWVDQTQEGVTMTHQFTLVTWGKRGLEFANQKAAIRDYLAANSTATNWPKVYPELFSETDFVIIPNWDRMAVSPVALDIGLFSSSVPTGKFQDNMQKFAPSGFSNTDDYPKFIRDNCAATSMLYRGMQAATMGSPNNKDQNFLLTDIYPDYMHASTESADFSRMTNKTQEFILKLRTGMDIAYTVNANNAIPSGYTKQMYNNRLFVVFVADGYQWMILSRMSFLAGV